MNDLSPLLPHSVAAICNMYIHDLIHIKKPLALLQGSWTRVNKNGLIFH